MSRILIVDDEPVIVSTLEMILKSNGFECDSANTGNEALQKVISSNYDLVLLDIMLPDVNGYEVCSSIKDIKSDLPVILVTALVDNVSLKQGFEVGAIDYIRKPVDDIELISRVNNALRIKTEEDDIKNSYSRVMNDLDNASTSQTRTMPSQFVIQDKIIASSLYTPFVKVGGDFFDIINVSSDKYFVYIGDISGHGVQSALLVNAVKVAIDMIIKEFGTDIEPYFVMDKLNNELMSNILCDNYITMIFGVIDLTKMTFDYFNAGHPPVMEFDFRNSTASKIESDGSLPLGWDINMEFSRAQQGTMALAEDKAVILYTDGIIECSDSSGEQIGIDGIVDVMSDADQVSDCLLIPHLLRSELMSRDYDITQDDFSIFTFQMIPQNRNRMYFDIKNLDMILPKHLKGEIDLKITSELSIILGKKVFEWTNDHELETITEIVIAEFMNNILIHGLDKKPGDLIIEISVEDAVVIRFIDNGIEWNPEDKRSRAVKHDKDAESGRGMNMIFTAASNFHRRRIDCVNETIIEIGLSPVNYCENEL